MNKHKVLIVDDEQDIQHILTQYLQRIEGVEVVNALQGEEAVERYTEMLENEDAPSLVIMDLNLSGSNRDMEAIDRHRHGEDAQMDGAETARAIKAIDAHAVIWGYTAWEGSDWEHELREAGVERVMGREIPFKTFAA